MADIFDFDSPDLVNLQRWYRKAPKRFIRAVTGVVTTLAFEARAQAIQNIKNGTITRNPRFVSASMRVEKAKRVSSLNQVVAEMGSIDISRKGLSSGFEELETGGQSTSNRVPTLASRGGGNENKKVSPTVRFNKVGKFHRPKHFRSPRNRSKRAQASRMLNAIRNREVENKPFIMPSGLKGPMGRMPPGIWRRKGKDFKLMNPFQGRRGRTKKIEWMTKAVALVSERGNLLKIWRKEIDFILRKKK